MWRFIVISFAFLAFAFYELSGGQDFDPEATRLARIEAPADVAARTLAPVESETPRARVAAAPAALPAAPADSAEAEQVTRISLNLSSTSDITQPQRTLRTVPAARTVAAPAEDTLTEEPTIILPSLLVETPVIKPVEFGGNSVVVTGETTRDVRRVSGNRVNMRGGPGTNYDVVGRLVRGDEVVVLQDPGNGWVKLRPVSGGSVGWMADFLLTQG